MLQKRLAPDLRLYAASNCGWQHKALKPQDWLLRLTLLGLTPRIGSLLKLKNQIQDNMIQEHSRLAPDQQTFPFEHLQILAFQFFFCHSKLFLYNIFSDKSTYIISFTLYVYNQKPHNLMHMLQCTKVHFLICSLFLEISPKTSWKICPKMHLKRIPT